MHWKEEVQFTYQTSIRGTEWGMVGLETVALLIAFYLYTTHYLTIKEAGLIVLCPLVSCILTFFWVHAETKKQFQQQKRKNQYGLYLHRFQEKQ